MIRLCGGPGARDGCVCIAGFVEMIREPAQEDTLGGDFLALAVVVTGSPAVPIQGPLVYDGSLTVGTQPADPPLEFGSQRYKEGFGKFQRRGSD